MSLGLLPVFLEKKIFPKILEKDITIRPENSQKQTSGFPSGHVQIVSFLATYLTLYFMETEELSILVIFSWLTVFFVSYERIKSENHLRFQVLFGLIFGILFGLLAYIPIFLYKNKYLDSYEIVKNMKNYFNIK